MPLPKIDIPAYTTTLPSTKKEVRFRPFLVKEEKILLMANQGDDENEKVNVTFSGVNIKGKDGKEVNVKFLPWVIFGVCFVLTIIGLILFTIYNIFKLFV